MAATTVVRPPPRALSWANRILERVLGRGKGPPFLRLLTVPGRRTGQPRTTPIAPVFGDGGSVWLVGAYGETGWVRNVRAAGRVELHRGDESTLYDVRELGAVEAVPVLRAYLAQATSSLRKGLSPGASVGGGGPSCALTATLRLGR